jgi:hypothetical protein
VLSRSNTGPAAAMLFATTTASALLRDQWKTKE